MRVPYAHSDYTTTTLKILSKILYLIILCLFLTYPTKAEESYYFKRFGVENGLAQNTVCCIMQDKQGFMWFGTKDGLSRYDGYRFKTYRNDKKNPYSIGNNYIRSMYEHPDGNIWIGTDNGVYVFDPVYERFTAFDLVTKEGIHIEKEVNDIKQDKKGNLWFAVDWQGVFSYHPEQDLLTFYELNTIVNAWYICIDREDKVWIGTHGGGLNCFNPEENKFEIFNFSDDGQEEFKDDIYCVFQDNYNDILIGTANNGIKRLNLLDKKIHSFLESYNGQRLFIREIIRRTDTEIWFGTESGVIIYDSQSHTFKNILHNHLDPYSISDNAVYSIYKDKEGGIWVGTYFGGVNYYPYPYTSFERFYPLNDNQSMRGKRVRELVKDKNGNIWIGTEDEGLNKFNPVTKSFEHFMPDNRPGSISYHNIHGLFIDDDHLWVGTFRHGLNIMDIHTGKVIRHYGKTEDPNSLCDNSIFSIYKDHSGTIWIGTLYGLCIYNPDTDNFTKVEEMGELFIYDILQTYDGMLWFATAGTGLYRFNPRTEKWKKFEYNPSDEQSITHNKVIGLFEDSRKVLWITTEGGGLCRYNPDEESFRSFTTENGLPNDVVYTLLEDESRKLWLTTNKGLVCFDPGNLTFTTYTRTNGLLGDQFNYKSGFKDANNVLYFGGMNGFVRFDPRGFRQNTFVPPVYITSFILFDQTIVPGEVNNTLPHSLTYAKEINLKHNESTFSFDFSALSYTAPEKNQYYYMLEGFDKDWNYLRENQRVNYSNVPYGKHNFRVKGSNSDGVWNNDTAALLIHIRPPFFQSPMAYFIYFILTLLLAFYVYISLKNRNFRKLKRRRELFENEKEKELYGAKIAFFTNIAHEIRTPLTLIKGPLEYIMKNNPPKKEMDENLEVIERNTNRLLDLTNQLLDFRKTEKEGFELHYVSTDINQLIKDIHKRFNLTAIQRNISFALDLPEENVYADVDKEALTKILSNLFTNAIKFADEQIRVSLNTDSGKGYLYICVSSDGKQIPGSMKEKIFQPFFQIEDKDANQIRSGTGLGLPLARSLAELHKGSLILETNPEGFNSFILQLPLIQHGTVKLEKKEEKPAFKEKAIVPEPNTKSGNKPVVLVVEDDKEMQQFLDNRLNSYYQVIRVNHGVEALDVLDQERVDIVITDIMMPVMDGLELCREIKSNLDYSHIPVIMLTAKTGLQSRIEGLDVGADAYLEKPFSLEHLLAQISNLVANRNKLKDAFINSPYINIGSIAPTKADEQFLKQVTEVIHKNLSDSNFNVDILAESLGMSRSSLHRKIKGVSELTPNEFILLVRLKKAAEYLQEGSYRINEVCYVVGFSSSSYFSKSFKKQFGMSPKDFIKRNDDPQ